MPITKEDLTLLVLALSGGEPLTPVQLQKSVFLLGRRLTSASLPVEFYNFTPYNYGPFDSAVYDDARALAEEGLATVEAQPYATYSIYSATSDGIARGLAIAAELPQPDAELAKRIVDWTRSQSFSSLVSAIYKAYPEFQVNSVFRGI